MKFMFIWLFTLLRPASGVHHFTSRGDRAEASGLPPLTLRLRGGEIKQARLPTSSRLGIRDLVQKFDTRKLSVRTYLAVSAAALMSVVIRSIVNRVVSSKAEPAAPAPAAEPHGLVGRWELDGGRSESLTPFLVSVGAPWLIARAVGGRGAPVTIGVDGNAALSLTLDGKAAEVYSTAGSVQIETPGGAVSATLSAKGVKRPPLDSFSVLKAGPRPGETTTEVRELLDDGSMRVVLAHSNPTTGEKVTVTRYYERADPLW